MTGPIYFQLFVFENEKLIASYALLEDIADFTVCGNLVFNARNTDVTVTEMRPGRIKSSFKPLNLLIKLF